MYFNADIETSCVDGESSFDATMWGRILKMGGLDGHNFYKNGEIEWIFTRIKKELVLRWFSGKLSEEMFFEIFAPFPFSYTPTNSFQQ